ncbi:MAG: hypothetical protein JO354_06585 [Verrucomicrobia bacterium]|nr:hypothetical protein [Verrucomicrobiota bacterium]
MAARGATARRGIPRFQTVEMAVMGALAVPRPRKPRRPHLVRPRAKPFLQPKVEMAAPAAPEAQVLARDERHGRKWRSWRRGE